MRIDGIKLSEGSNISNMTVASGTAFPSSPNAAELFFRTDTDITIRGMYLYINNGWDRLASADTLSAPAGTTLPSAALAGDLYYLNSNDSSEALYAYDGAAWNKVSNDKAVAISSANGFAGTVDNATAGTVTITLTTNVTGILKGNGTAISAAVAGDFPTLNQNTTGSAATLTTPRTISTTGDSAWTTTFNGSANVTGTATLATVNSSPQTDALRKVTVNGKGLVTATSAVIAADLTSIIGINDLLPSQTAQANKFLKTDGANTSWGTPLSIPGGSTTQIQFNDGGVFAGNSNFTINKTTGVVSFLVTPTINGTAVGTGTVSSVSVVSANGFAGSVATNTTTPAITISTSIVGLLKGNGTSVSNAAVGTDYSNGTSALGTGILKSTTSTGALSIAAAGDFPTLNQNTTGTATNATNAVNSGITNDVSTNATVYPTWVTASSGNLPIKVSSTKTTLNPSTGLFTSSAFSTPGSLTFTGTGNRILGDFANATLANRVLFQSSTTNSQTTLGLVPNGTTVGSQVTVYSTNNPANSSTMIIGTNSGTGYLSSDITGTGTYRPMVFNTSGATKMILDTSGNLGIGVTAPLNDLHVQRDAAMAGAFTSYTSDTAGASGSMILQRARGSFASATAVQDGDTLGKLIFSGATTASAFINSASIESIATENYSATNAGSALIFFTTLIGSTARTERMRVNSAGNVTIGTAALATTATDGFLQITSMPGQPSATPTANNTGVFPMVFDSTNNALMFYNNISASWKNVATAATAAASLLTGTTLASNVVSSSLTSVGTLSNLAVTGTTTSGAFRANQGIPTAADLSTNGYAFGIDGDTGMFGPGSAPGAGVVAMYTNNAEAARFTSTGFSTGLNLAFTGTGNRITGDFTNATLANRVLFQTRTANSTSSLGIIPSGSGASANAIAFNNSDPTNSGFIQIGVNTTAAVLVSGAAGSGTALPLQFQVNGAVRGTFDTSGNLAFQSTGAAVTNIISQNSGQLAGFRNRLINGQILVDSRNAGAAITPTATQYTADRWGFYPSVASKLTFQQVGDAPAGFINSMKVTVASQYTPAATDFFHWTQVVEAYNCIDFQYGGAGAQTATLSFWVKGSVAGTYAGSIRGATTTQAYPFTFAVTTGWTKIILTFAGPTSGTWGTYTAAGFNVTIDMGSGANFNGTAGAWAVGNFTTTSAGTRLVSQVNGSTLNLTGFQVELGTVATVFEQRTHSTEIALCQRYYEKVSNDVMAYNAASSNGGGRSKYAVPKRVNPTITQVANNVSYGQTNVNSSTCAYVGATTEGLSHYRVVTATGQFQYSEIAEANADF